MSFQREGGSCVIPILRIAIAVSLALTMFLAMEYFGERMDHLETLVAEEQTQTRQELEKTQTELERVQAELRGFQEQVEDLAQQIQELEDFQAGWLEKFGVTKAKVTSYAPLDPGAVAGMCFSGDPNVTASGGSPIPGETVAGGSFYRFGDRVWIEGWGLRVVNDRGGRIRETDLDLVMATRREAIAFGNQELWVLFERGD